MVSGLRVVDERTRETGYAIILVNCNHHFILILENCKLISSRDNPPTWREKNYPETK